jgi:phosphogluconate dehydratase
MSGASGKVLSAIHVTPEASDGGGIGRVRDGDVVLIDGDAGVMEARVPAVEWNARTPQAGDLTGNRAGYGRELFALMRAQVGTAEEGGSALFVDEGRADARRMATERVA